MDDPESKRASLEFGYRSSPGVRTFDTINLIGLKVYKMQTGNAVIYTRYIDFLNQSQSVDLYGSIYLIKI